MSISREINESISQRLQQLYQQQGYGQYKMNKFETYDFYVQNKDFLVSDSIITFTDTDGRLMALKPDVTLSIAKGYRPEAGTVQKLFYNESVYRTVKGDNGFQEITQIGLECLGELDMLNVCQTIALAAASLAAISEDHLLELAHMGLVTGLLAELPPERTQPKQLLSLVAEKNRNEVAALCREWQLPEPLTAAWCELAELYGEPEPGLERLERIALNPQMQQAVAELWQIFRVLGSLGYGARLRLDFSLLNNMNYYTGVVFQGFIAGVPAAVLSGGRYDKLMRKLGQPGGAIGFAVYLNLLERLDNADAEYDVDTVLLYTAADPVEQVLAAAARLSAAGGSVSALMQPPHKLKYRRLLTLAQAQEGGRQ